MGHPQCPGTVAKPPNSRSPTGFLPVYLLAAGEAERTRRTGDKRDAGRCVGCTISGWHVFSSRREERPGGTKQWNAIDANAGPHVKSGTTPH
jgi:hypothetical protein